MLTVDSEAVGCYDAPVSKKLQMQMQILADMVNTAMRKADGHDSAIYGSPEKPSKEQKELFRRLYDTIMPDVRAELSKTGTIVSEEYPWVFS